MTERGDIRELRFLRLARAHPLQIRRRDARVGPDADEQTLSQGLTCDYGYRTADSWERALRSLGHEAELVVVNDRRAVDAWARETGLRTGGHHRHLNVAMERAVQLRPDVLFVSDFGVVPPGWVNELRRRLPSIRLVVGWIGARHDDLEYFRSCDLMLCCVPELIESYRDRGVRIVLAHHAFDPDVLGYLPPRSPALHVTFVGQLQRTPGRHEQRVQLLHRMHQSGVPLRIFAPQASHEWAREALFGTRRLVWQADRVVGRLGITTATRDRFLPFRKVRRWESTPPTWRHRGLTRHVEPPVFGLDMFRLFRASAVTLNVHADVSRRQASNLRMFEATGAGSCLLTEQHENLGAFFEPGTEVMTYASFDEAVERAVWLLEHGDERERIARAGQERTLRDHTVAQRVTTFVELVQEQL